MQQLIILIGLPSSGKSTWARKWVSEDPKNRVRINRDDIRRQLGPYWVPSREKLVTKLEIESVYNALILGYSVVVDATNLNKKYYNWPTFYKTLPVDIVLNIEFVENKSFLEVPIEECIRRDSLRTGDEYVGEEVIRNMAKNIQ